MSTGKPDDLIDTYRAAESTLEEEKTLFTSPHLPPELARWATYVGQQRKKAPLHLKEMFWAAIQARKRKRQRRLVGLSGLAAAIALFIIFFNVVPDDGNTSDNDKKITLKEALALFPDEKQQPETERILYEDELIIVYVTAN